MKSHLVKLSKRHRANVRSAVRRAIRDYEEKRARIAYLAKPDSETEADDWTSAEEWKPLKPPEVPQQ